MTCKYKLKTDRIRNLTETPNTFTKTSVWSAVKFNTSNLTLRGYMRLSQQTHWNQQS